MQTFATFPCPPGFLDAGVTFLPAFLEGAWDHCQICENHDVTDIYHLALLG